MSIVLGIDPGKQGAIAMLDTFDGTLAIHDMPDTTSALQELIAGLPIIKLALAEKPFFPGNIGVNNAVKIARGYERIVCCLAWRSIPMHEIEPSKWKPQLGLSDDKAASREKASQMFPDYAHLFRLAKNDGRAEAALLAHLASGKAVRG